MPNFRTVRFLFSKKTTHGPLVVGAYYFINSQTCDVVFSLFFEKSRQRHSGVIKLSTGAIANSLKTAVAPTHDKRIETVKHAFDRFYSETIRLC